MSLEDAKAGFDGTGVAGKLLPVADNRLVTPQLPAPGPVRGLRRRPNPERPFLAAKVLMIYLLFLKCQLGYQSRWIK